MVLAVVAATAALTACASAVGGAGASRPRPPEVPLDGPGDVAIDGQTASPKAT
jgi:hypothetical protein